MNSIPKIEVGQKVVVYRNYYHSDFETDCIIGAIDGVYGNWAVSLDVPGYPGLFLISQASLRFTGGDHWEVRDRL